MIGENYRQIMAALKDLQQDMLVAMASGQHHSMVLALFCKRIEAILKGTTCTVVAHDCANGRLQSVSAPSLPVTYTDAVAQETVGPTSGWGGAAIARREPVATRDIAADAAWQRCKSLALGLKLRGAWTTPVTARSGDVIGAVSLYFRQPRDVTLLEMRVVSECLNLCAIALEAFIARERLNELASFDPLTGLGNRGMFKDRIGRILEHALKAQQPIGFFCVDLDDFRAINDLHGQANGDVLISRVANRLRSITPDAELVVRMGGNQFLIVRAVNAATADFDVIAKDLVAGIGETYELEDGTVVDVSASVGVARFPVDGDDEDALMAHAETALHSAKSTDCGFVVFASQMRIEEQKRRVLEREANLANQNNQLFVVYQPQADAQTCEICGFEALLRWQHPELGFIPPSDFIPIAEASGAITAMGAFVLREACFEAASWPVPLRVAVNVSPAQICRGNFAEVVRDAILQTGLSPERLEVEVTESLLMQDSARALTVLREIKAMGVSVALDDFGTGYSSLSTLRAFPFDRIKIDRSFVFDMTTNSDASAIVNSVLSLAKALRLTVVAEGVETQEQLHLLRLLGCDLIQGYLIGKPLSPGNYGHITGITANAKNSAIVA